MCEKHYNGTTFQWCNHYKVNGPAKSPIDKTSLALRKELRLGPKNINTPFNFCIYALPPCLSSNTKTLALTPNYDTIPNISKIGNNFHP